MAGRQIIVDIVGDATKFNKTMDATGRNATTFGDKLKTAFKVAAGAALAVGAVTAVGMAVFEAGAKMEAMDVKAKTVFGDQLALVDKWAKKNAAAMGLTSREATGLAANFADLLIPMGFTRDAAAAMSTDVVGLSGALSEWSGGTTSAAEVADILAKAMLGERDALKSLGISITAADVEARLLVNGTNELTGAALEQAKALATQQLIMEKSTDAQAAYAAGTAVGIRSQHEMEAKLKEVGETLTNALYPVLLTVGGFLADNLPAAIKTTGDVFNWLSTNVLPTLRVVFDVVGKSIQGWVAIIGGVVAAVGWLVNVFIGLGAIIGAIWNGVTTTIKGAINFVIDIINSAIRGINKIQVHIHVGPIKYDFNGLNLGYIPRLHLGGIVPGQPGAEVLTMLQAGERVSPAGSSAGSGMVINFYGPVFGDDQFIDDFTRKIAMRLRTAG